MSAPRIIGHRIGRELLTTSGACGPVYNPATGEKIAEVCFADDAIVSAAVSAATTACHEWSQTAALRRARILFKFKALLEEHFEELAAMITLEHGKVLADARGELVRGIEVVEFACGIPQLLKGEYSDNIGGGIDNWSMREPIGVCAGITPFNFPAMVPMWMFPLAIACGNTFVLKPSERDPGVSIRFAELLDDAGLPAGVFNIVQGDGRTVDALLTHPDVGAVSFVGSTRVAESIYQRCASHGKRAQALGGAKNHLLVMPDADLEQVVDALVGAGYGSAGERCMAVSVAVAVGEIAGPLVDRLKERILRLEVNDGFEEGAEMGPLVTEEHRARVLDYIRTGLVEGAELVVDGRDFRVAGRENGFFLGPCLFDKVTAAMRIYREEIFGPVLSVVRADTFAEALALINAHEYGNGASCYTSDGRIAREFCRNVSAGMVGINVPIPVPMAFHSFGGRKRSLFGDLHIYGEEGVRFYTRYKSIMQRWPETDPKGPEFVMPTHR
jgi:malonate-semialdehyde dehydrogenase (acetylating)/methylmalonate-semialdehyde dehydrogenase